MPKIPKSVPIAYVVKDINIPTFEVKKSANAWWMDSGKVSNLILAFKIGANTHEACDIAGISSDQYKYFVSQHPDFSTIKQACEQLQILKARETITKNLDHPRVAMWYLAKKLPHEFGNARQLGKQEEKFEPVTTTIVHVLPDGTRRTADSPKT